MEIGADVNQSAKSGSGAEAIPSQINLTTKRVTKKSPPLNGLQIAVVKQLSHDPEGLNRILISLPSANGEIEFWALFSNFYATSGAGGGFLPEIGDEVVVGFINGSPENPIVLGSLYSQKKPPLNIAADEKNDLKTLSTRSLLKISFDDAKKSLKIETPAGNSILLNDEGKSIEILDQNDNSIKMTDKGIILNSPKDIVLKAGGDIILEANMKVAITSNQDVEISGMNVTHTAQLGFLAKGNATAELSATGETMVKGAMVMIN